jgi:hypothetical protein
VYFKTISSIVIGPQTWEIHMEKVKVARKPLRATAALAAAVALAIFAGKSDAALIPLTWDGSAGDWFDQTHWSPTAIPYNTAQSTYVPTIPGGTLTLGNNATVSSLNLASTGTLLFSPGEELNILGSPGYTLGGNIYLDLGSVLSTQGTGSITSASVTGPGSLTATGGAITFAGRWTSPIPL